MIALKDPGKLKTIALHTLIWIIYISIGVLRKVLAQHYTIDPLDIVITQLPMVYVFYANYYILVRYMNSRQYLQLFLAEIFLFTSCALLYYFTGYILAPYISKYEEVPPFSLAEHIIYTLWVYMIYSFFSYGYYFARQSVRNEKQLRIMELEKLRMEQDKLKAEYAFLRAQINPHFLHNTLNFFYARSLPYSTELSEGILVLCEIMRYSLNNDENDAGTVGLVKEIEHVQNVIRINQLRFSNRLRVVFDIEGDVNSVHIVPLVIITLVENAFKHGELTNEAHPLTLRLEVSEDNRHLTFSTRNKKKKGPKELSHGIGLDNTRKRLQAVYKDQYRLNILDEEDYYTVNLLIDLPAPAATTPVMPALAGEH